MFKKTRKHNMDYIVVHCVVIIKHGMNNKIRLQTTQHTSDEAVTAVTNCCANCVEHSRPQVWGPDLLFWGQAGHADPLDGWRCSS